MATTKKRVRTPKSGSTTGSRAKRSSRVPAPRRKRAAAGKRASARGGVEFNHAMIYTKKLARSLAFYRDLLGFRVVDEYPGFYVRLASPRGGTTIALHVAERGMRLDPRRAGVRLYFEVAGLDRLCKRLVAKRVNLDQPPEDMPWGWRHAYLRDPDGHELSLFWSRGTRLERTEIG